MFILFGWRQKMITVADAFSCQCPFCEQANTTVVAVNSKYYHIFWLPVFPFAKSTHAACTSCHASRNEYQYGPELTRQAKVLQKEVKHPFYLYLLTILLCLLIAAVYITRALKR
jgi:hypothetical protein